MGFFSWFRRPPLDLDEEDFKEEIRAHLAIARQEKIDDGVDSGEAHYAAIRDFGNVTRTVEAARRVWTPRWLEALRDLSSDVRYGVRALAKAPAFSLAVIGVLTLGIGLNAAVFTMLKSFVFSPIGGVADARRLAVVHGETSAGRAVRLSYPDYRHIRDHAQSFTQLYASILMKANLGRGRQARQIWGELVTDNYFDTLGIGAQRGRTIGASDEVAPGRHPIVVISEGLWRRDFASDPAIVGRTIEINNYPLTVVGVAAKGFFGTTVVYDVEVFVPVMMAPDLGFTFGSKGATPSAVFADPDAAMFYPSGYLKPGVTRTRAEAEMQTLWSARPAGGPAAQPPARMRVVNFLDSPGGAPSYIMPTLVVLGAMGLLVLAVASANLAGLVMVRGVSRRGEVAVRLALGASRARIVRLLLVENLVLAIPGAILGVLVARAGIPFLASYAQRLAAPLLIHFNTDIDALVVGFAVIVACGSVLLFGFLPALRTTRVDLVSAINEDASPRGASRGRGRSVLVVAQVAMSLLLLVGAGLATRSVEAARRTNPGFQVEGTTAVSFDLKQNAYDAARGRLFYRRLLDALRADPSIESASLAAYVPMNMTDTRADRIELDGYTARQDEDLAFMSNMVGPGYFRTLRIPMVAGREFEDIDDLHGEPVAIVNRTLAERYWGEPAGAVGKRLRTADGRWRTVVGVAADAKYARISDGPRPYFYLPLLESYRSSVTLHTRGTAAVDTLVEGARRHVTALDPDLPILSSRSMARAVRGAMIFYDLSATMLLTFGVAGIALATMGTYGLVSYTVKQSTHEIGIRMALGASSTAVLGQFLRRGLFLGAIGAGIGIVAALASSNLLSSVLFGVRANDAGSLLQALLIVLAAVALATTVPSWRAARTNPLNVLRHD